MQYTSTHNRRPERQAFYAAGVCGMVGRLWSLCSQRSYVHGLQEALGNRTAGLGREVPKQSGSHLAAGKEVRETRSSVLSVGALQVQKGVIKKIAQGYRRTTMHLRYTADDAVLILYIR